MSRSGQVILITGAASGMGQEAARVFAAEKASLVLVDRSEITDKFENALKIKADLVKDNEVIDLVDMAIKKYGKLDVLLNIAGILAEGSLLTTPLELYDRVMAINLRAIFHLTKLCAPHLIKTKGCVINMSSYGSVKIHPQYIVYLMTKATLNHFTKSIALELAPFGVRVNAINPGVTDTPMLPPSKYNMEKLSKEIPLRRTGTVNDVAQVLQFLTSDAASYITGANLFVDGGICLT